MSCVLRKAGGSLFRFVPFYFFSPTLRRTTGHLACVGRTRRASYEEKLYFLLPVFVFSSASLFLYILFWRRMENGRTSTQCIEFLRCDWLILLTRRWRFFPSFRLTFPFVSFAFDVCLRPHSHRHYLLRIKPDYQIVRTCWTGVNANRWTLMQTAGPRPRCRGGLGLLPNQPCFRLVDV